MVLGISPSAQTSRAQTAEYRPDKFAEAGRIHRVQFVLVAVMHIMVVKRRTGQTDAVGILVVVG